MRAVGIVGDPPCFDEPAGMGIVQEEMLVEAFIAEPADEALDKRVLLWFAGLDVVPLDVPVALPLEDGMTGQFRAVV